MAIFKLLKDMPTCLMKFEMSIGRTVRTEAMHGYALYNTIEGTHTIQSGGAAVLVDFSGSGLDQKIARNKTKREKLVTLRSFAILPLPP